MTTFDLWSKNQREKSGTINLTKDDIESSETVSCRTGPGAADFRTCTRIKKTDGKTIYLACPAGEVEDRLNDADAKSPDIFENLEEESS